MRSCSVALIVLAMLVAVPGSSMSKPAAPRTETRPYTTAQSIATPETPQGAFVGTCAMDEGRGCVRFMLKRSDRYIDLEILDSHGLPVYAIAFGPDGREVGDLCGKTTEPIASPGEFIDVWLANGSCFESPQPSLVTTGEVKATFHRSL